MRRQETLCWKETEQMKVKYIGKQYLGRAFEKDKVYEVISIEKDWYRIMTELDEDYLFPPELFEIVEEWTEEDNNIASVTLTPEQIEKYREWLKQAVPYTEKEVMDIPFDSRDYDLGRLKAYSAKKSLQEAGLLDEEEKA